MPFSYQLVAGLRGQRNRWPRAWAYVISVALALAPLRIAICGSPDQTNPRDPATVLSQFGFSADAVGLRKCLAQFQFSADERAEVQNLVAQLADARFQVRTDAMQALAARPLLPRDILDRAVASSDAEVRQRAKQLLELSDARAGMLLEAALTLVAERKLQGLTNEVLAAAAYTGSVVPQELITRALQATVVAGDEDRLRNAATTGHPSIRAAATTILAAMPETRSDMLSGLLADTNEHARLAAALGLANRGDRRVLEPLAGLMMSDDREVRRRSAAALAWLAGQKDDFDPDADAATRKKAAEAWRTWALGEGRAVKLRFPLPPATEVALFNGRDLDGWTPMLRAKPRDGSEAWSVRDGAIVASRQAFGYLRTERKYKNYRLRLQWRWPGGVGGDSGVFLLMPGPDKLPYPDMLEVQLQAGSAGDFYTTKLPVTVRGRRYMGHERVLRIGGPSEKPLGEWNQLEVSAKDGKVTVRVNGTLQNEATDCPTEAGYIALQVEHGAIEFRNVALTQLDE